MWKKAQYFMIFLLGKYRFYITEDVWQKTVKKKECT